MFSRTPVGPETSLSLCYSELYFVPHPVEDYLQQHLTSVRYQRYHAVVSTYCRVSFLEKWYGGGLCPILRPVTEVILFIAFVTESPPSFRSSAGISSGPSVFLVLITLSAFSSSYVEVGSRSPPSFTSSVDLHVEYSVSQ